MRRQKILSKIIKKENKEVDLKVKRLSLKADQKYEEFINEVRKSAYLTNLH